MTTEHQTDTARRQPAIEFTIDGETYETQERELTVGTILGLAGKDPAAHYLVEIRGRRERHEYKNPSDNVKLHPGSKFVTVSTGPTPVS